MVLSNRKAMSIDIFVHISAVEKAGIANLKEGDSVSYEIATQKGKQTAVNLELID